MSQTILRASPLTRTLAIAIGSLMLSAPAWTQQAAADQEASAVPKATSVEPMALTIDDAVTSALAKDPGVISANLDWLSAIAKADSASWKKLPSLSANAGYTRLSELSASDSEMNVVIQGMPYSVALPSLPNMYSFSLDLSYPIYDGNRVKESNAIASLQVQAKDVSKETAKRSLAFDVRRAYWEAVRSTYNRATLEQNLELMKKNSELTNQELGQGVATPADQLAAQMRLEQAKEDVGDARSSQMRAFLTLSSLMGADIASLGISTAAEDAPLPFDLSTKPDESNLQDGSAALNEVVLVSDALARRPETRSAELARRLAEHAIELSRAALYPTVTITGNYTYADPNQRVYFQTDPTLFTGTWALGLQLNFDIGGVPAAIDDIKAQTLAASKAKTDEDRQRNAVVMDVEICIVNLERARHDLASTAAMVEQARENLRVVQGRVAAGSAKDIDLNSAQFDLLKAEFAVTNKRIDVLIAQADLTRAIASENLK
ncbi:MAG: TolC family protein [Spirochaetia bacterium]